jgi:hypothetical protein
MGKSSNLLRKGLATVIDHHGQAFRFGDIEFKAVASPPATHEGPGPIGFGFGRDYTVELRAARDAFAALPISGDAIYDENGRRYVVGGVSEQPGGFSVRIWCRVDQYR